MPEFRVEGVSVTFWVNVKPRCAREQLRRLTSRQLCLELAAPPVEGQANEACVRFFARSLRLPQACVVILSGRKSRRKLIRVTGRSSEETVAQLKALAAKGSTGRPS